MTGPIRDTTGERIQDAFVESPTRALKTAVEVSVGNFDQVKSINGALSNIKWDAFSYDYPTAVQEIISLYEGGLSGALKATITLNYTDSTKSFFTNGTVVV